MFATIERMLEAVGIPTPDMPHVCNPNDSEMGGYFVPKEWHIRESLVASIYACLVIYYFANGAAIKRFWSNTFKTTQPRHWSDYAILGVAIPSLALIVYHKYQKGRLWFLLQPCHVLQFILIVMCLLPPGNGIGAYVFNVFLHWLFGPFLGLVAADLACYQLKFELENWFLQHVLLLCAPLVFIATRRHPLITDHRFFLHATTMKVLFHFSVIEAASLYSASNINFVLCPPNAPLEALGKYYRSFMIIGFYILAAFVRYGLPGGFCMLTGTPDGDGNYIWEDLPSPNMVQTPLVLDTHYCMQANNDNVVARQLDADESMGVAKGFKDDMEPFVASKHKVPLGLEATSANAVESNIARKRVGAADDLGPRSRLTRVRA